MYYELFRQYVSVLYEHKQMESKINGCYEVIKFLAHLFRDEIKCFVERTEKALLIAKTKKFNLVGTLRNVQKGYAIVFTATEQGKQVPSEELLPVVFEKQKVHTLLQVITYWVKEMECLRTNKHEMKNIKMGADEEWTLCDKKEVLELDISYPIEKIHAQTFGIKISTGKNRQFEIVFCKEKQCCFVDRTTAGVNPHDKFAGKYKAPVDFTQEFLTIKLLMDVSQSELFINNGEVVMSNLLFPEDFYKVKLFATGGDLVIEKSIIYEMDEIMNHPLDGNLI